MSFANHDGDTDGGASGDQEASAAATATDTTAGAQSFSTEENEVFRMIQRDAANFGEYERQFQEVLMSLENDDVLEAFRNEYASLHHSFLKSHEGESRLLRKCHDLQSDVYTAVSKAQAAEEFSLSDRRTIESLKTEIDRTRKKCGSTREKEGQLRGKIDKLKQELVELDKLAHEPVEAAVQEAALQSLLRVHETVLKEKENQEYRVSTLQYDIAAAERRLMGLRESTSASHTELSTIAEAIASKQRETEAILSRKLDKEEELKATREELTRRNALLSERQQKIERLREDGARHQEDIRHTMEETEGLAEAYQTLCRQVQHTNTALQECTEENDVMQRKVREAMTALQQQQGAVLSAHKQYVKENQILEAMRRRNVVAEERRGAAEQQKHELSEEVARQEEALALLRTQAAADEKELEAVHRELDVLHQEHLTAEGVTQRNRAWLAEKKSQLAHAERALSCSEAHAQKHNEAVYKTSKECLAYEAQATRSAQQCATLLSEVNAIEAQITETKGGLADVERRLAQQQELLDSVIKSRNAYAKHHSELRHDLSEMNKRFQLILSQIQQIKEGIVHKERDIVSEEASISGLQRQRKGLEVQIQGLQRRAAKKSRTVDLFNGELRKLSDVLADATDEVARQQRLCRDVLHDRDLLSSQAVQRSKELTTLYEKLHTQQALLQRGESMYRDRVRHIDQLEYQTAKLARQLEKMQQFVARLPDLRLLINNASRELSRERAKVAALMNTCEQPLNVHPNHELAWSEPETFALTERVRDLQRELGQRRQLLDETERSIQETEQRYMKAKATVAKQPGPEVAEQLTSYQANLVKKQAHMQQMQESLRYFREQVESYRSRHDELREQLNSMAKEYASRRTEEEKRLARGVRMGANEDDGEGEMSGAGHAEDPHHEPLVYAGFVAPPMPPSST